MSAASSVVALIHPRPHAAGFVRRPPLSVALRQPFAATSFRGTTRFTGLAGHAAPSRARRHVAMDAR